MIKNLFCAFFALVMSDVDNEDALCVVDKVVIFYIGGEESVGTGFYCIVNEK